MRKQLSMVAFAVAATFSALAANTWYVDAVNGNDEWDGKADYAAANPESKVGPKKTLSVFTSLVGSGDTIYAAPGHYKDLTSPEATSYRFYTFVGNISLIATGSATNTFIEGAADSTVSLTTSPYGCGANAIVPVKMLGGNNLIKGFTITGGRQINYTSAYGGGVVFDSTWTDTMADCVVTNCVANRGGGVYYLGTALRCHFTGNYASEGAHGFYVKTAVNCLFENTSIYAVYNGNYGGTVLNCTFRGNKSGNYRTNGTGKNIISVYNSVLLKESNTPKNKGCDFYNCLFDYDPTVLATSSEAIIGTNGACRVVALGKAKLNAEGTAMAGSPALDAGDGELYTAHFPASFASSEQELDLVRRARTNGTSLDLGAIERQDDTIDDTEWFVDAVNGDDANTGKTPQTAKKSLAAAMDGRISGETVHAAKGVYSNETMKVGSRLYRVAIPTGVRLVGTDGAEKTVILGARSSEPDSTYGTGPDAISCVYAYESDTAATWVTLKGFTLANGTAAAKSGEGAGYGAALFGKSRIAGIMADCVITNCVAARGPVYYFGHVVRCRFYDNTSVEGGGGAAYEISAVYDSYFRNSVSGVTGEPMHDVYQNAALSAGSCGIVVNCTFESSGYGGPHAANDARVHVYNSLMRCKYDGGGAYYHNCVNGASLDTAAQKNSEKDDATVITNFAGIALTEGTRRPVVGFNAAVGKGDYVLYTNLLPTVLKDIAGRDVWGNPRLVNGVLDVGAAACDRPAARVTDASTGLTVTGITADGLWHDAAPGDTYTLTRNYTSRLLLKGVYVNSAYVDFNAHEDGWSYAGTFTDGTALDIRCVYPAVNDWYVDKANGSDANDGLRPGAGHAFASLARASTNALMEAGATVYVAEGIYDSEIVPAVSVVDGTDSRMYVPYQVSFVATGRRSATVVVGASSSETACGIGAGAVRCCLMRGGSVRGFTMRGGNVRVGKDKGSDQGGGIRCSSSEAYAYDCEIYNCNAVRGGGAMGVRLVRCYLHDNTISTTGVVSDPARDPTAREAYQCSGYNSVIAGDCYLGTRYLNCTILGNGWGNQAVFLNCYLNGDGAGSSSVAAAFTNCVFAGSIKSFSQRSACVVNSPCAFDADFRAQRRRAAVVGAADASLYEAKFPSDLSAYSGLDFAGGARLLGDALDIGAGERDMARKGLTLLVR